MVEVVSASVDLIVVVTAAVTGFWTSLEVLLRKYQPVIARNRQWSTSSLVSLYPCIERCNMLPMLPSILLNMDDRSCRQKR